MAVFDPGDIAVGGRHEYISVYHSDGSFSQLVHVTDTGSISGATASGPQTYATGVAFRPPTSELFSTSTPSLNIENCPHDVDWIPNDSGLLVAVVPSSGVLKFRKYDFDGVQIGSDYTPAVPAGWGQQAVKISVACDSDTVFYTLSMKVVKRFSLSSGQLTDYQTLPNSSPYIFGGVRALPGAGGDGRDAIFPMTLLAEEGPRQAICLDSDGVSFWNDNFVSGDYVIEKRPLDVRDPPSMSVVTKADPDDLNDRTLSLACNYNPCPLRRLFVGFTTVIG